MSWAAGGTSPAGPHVDRGSVLLTLARHAIASSLELDAPVEPVASEAPATSGWLDEPGACFVTLHLRTAQGPVLRGCIGTIDPYRTLREDVRGNATSAAFADPRFRPLGPCEYPDLHVEVSELSPREPLAYRDRADLAAQLRPGVDGVILAYGGRRGTYLPQVWEQLPDPDAFLASLVTKARLPAGFWSDDIEAWRYTVTAYDE